MCARSVLISGAGIAGPALAFWLNAAGFKTTIVERAPGLRAGGYVLDFWGLGYDIAERMGLANALKRVGYSMREMRIVDDFVAEHDFRLALDRLEQQPGKIATREERPDCVRAQFRHGHARPFDLIIGADGLHSNVRRLAFGAQPQFEKDLGYVVAAFETQSYRPRDEDVYVIYSEPEQMVARFALHDDRTLFLFVFTRDDLQPTPDLAAQKATLSRRFGGRGWECEQILARLDGAPDLYFDRVAQIRMPSWSRGGVALIGDAAFCVSLMAGQGSALAMTAAYVLAGELAKAEGKHDQAFSRYEAILRAFIASKQKGAERFSGAFAPRTRLGLFVRNSVIRACAIPGAAKLAFSRDIADMLKLPDYSWPALARTPASAGLLRLPILERARNLDPCADCFSSVTPRLSRPSGASIMSAG